MAVNYTEQYYPISNLETGADDGLNYRHAQETAWGLNNWARHAGMGPVIRQCCIPHFQSLDGTNTAENVRLQWGPYQIPDGFNKFSVTVGGYTSTGSDDCVVKVYCTNQVYVGPEALDTTFLSAPYGVTGAITFSASAHSIPAADQAMVLPLASNAAYDNLVYFILTMTNDLNTQGKITAVSVTPKYI